MTVAAAVDADAVAADRQVGRQRDAAVVDGQRDRRAVGEDELGVVDVADRDVVGAADDDRLRPARTTPTASASSTSTMARSVASDASW